MHHITPKALKRKLEEESVYLIDVREKDEWNFCHLEGAELIPLMGIYNAEPEADDDTDIVVYCHSGQRSQFAVQVLQQKGYINVYNLSGGIDAYAAEVDSSIPRY